jgi:hypothetical protein
LNTTSSSTRSPCSVSMFTRSSSLELPRVVSPRDAAPDRLRP